MFVLCMFNTHVAYPGHILNTVHLTLSPAICREAFLLIAVPALFRARQEYTASWVWLFFPVTTLRKKRLPSGRMMGRDCPSIFSGSKGMPLRSHWMDGSGVPSARQESVAGLPTRTTTSDGWCTIRGEASSECSLEPKRNVTRIVD